MDGRSSNWGSRRADYENEDGESGVRTQSRQRFRPRVVAAGESRGLERLRRPADSKRESRPPSGPRPPARPSAGLGRGPGRGRRRSTSPRSSAGSAQHVVGGRAGLLGQSGHHRQGGPDGGTGLVLGHGRLLTGRPTGRRQPARGPPPGRSTTAAGRARRPPRKCTSRSAGTARPGRRPARGSADIRPSGPRRPRPGPISSSSGIQPSPSSSSQSSSVATRRGMGPHFFRFFAGAFFAGLAAAASGLSHAATSFFGATAR